MPHLILTDADAELIADALDIVSPDTAEDADRAKALAARIRTCLEAPTARDGAILGLALDTACDHGLTDGAVDFDDAPAISEDPDENGAYVAVWLWVDFAGTDLDKDDADLCAECGASLEGGEGFNGLCGECADRAENEKEEG